MEKNGERKMRWLKHDTNARNDLKIKLLKKKFGAEGYGVYFQLLEIIGEYIEKDNLDEWGMVNKFHTIETLAEECGVTPEKLREILSFCNEKELLQKKNNRLYCEKILDRLDEYAERIKAQKPKKKKSGQNRDSIGTKSGIDIDTEEDIDIEQKENKKNFAAKKINSLVLSPKQIQVILKEYPGLTNIEVKEQAIKCSDYMAISSSEYKNPGLFFRGWMKKFYNDWKTEQVRKKLIEKNNQNLPEISEEQRTKNIERIQEIKNNFPIKIMEVN